MQLSTRLREQPFLAIHVPDVTFTYRSSTCGYRCTRPSTERKKSRQILWGDLDAHSHLACQIALHVTVDWLVLGASCRCLRPVDPKDNNSASVN